jgi:hypothetical protein
MYRFDAMVADGVRCCRNDEHAEMYSKSKRHGATFCRLHHHFESGTRRIGVELIIAVPIVIVSSTPLPHESGGTAVRRNTLYSVLRCRVAICLVSARLSEVKCQIIENVGNLKRHVVHLRKYLQHHGVMSCDWLGLTHA